MIDFYGGVGTYASWPQRVRDYAIETTPVNLLDWACAYDFSLTPDMLATIDVPVTVVVGADSHPAVRQVNAIISESIGGADLVAIDGAAHFMIATHAAEVGSLIAGHVGCVERSLPDPFAASSRDKAAVGRSR
jgi:pimeloyl-ACP methyl ester carboxylesterase